ncbi:HAMP domain-containing sensor histidine kinase [Ideonella sp. A 288]|uniref:sensor histidine kinase n=1 Tax=Ideonella sp. A 288 TaxID=1962181 RepID=UPI000B4A6B85|nr:PAS domain-containing sensor histidine kinase [Ideonella sp. A 288]
MSDDEPQAHDVLLARALDAVRDGRLGVAEEVVARSPGITLGAVLELYRHELETQVQQLSESLQLTEAALGWHAAVLRRLPLPVLSLDGLARIVEANDGAHALLGFDEDMLKLAQPMRRVLADAASEGRFVEALRSAELAAGVTSLPGVAIATTDGRQLWADVQLMRVPPRHDGRDTRFLCVLQDRTEHILAEQASRAAADAERRRDLAESANQSKTELLSRVSHELRTPLNAVLGFSQLILMDEEKLEPRTAAQIRHISEAGRHLLSLVDEVLDLNKAEAGTLRLDLGAVTLAPLLDQVIELHGPAAAPMNLHLSVDLAPDARTAQAHADPRRVREVLNNLVSNAVKYNRRDGWVVARVSVDGPQVRIDVTDSGIGINRSQKEHLFEPFNRLGAEQLRVSGHGLGLSISRRLAEAMGGRLEATSAPGLGSCFSLFLRRWGDPR